MRENSRDIDIGFGARPTRLTRLGFGWMSVEQARDEAGLRKVDNGCVLYLESK